MTTTSDLPYFPAATPPVFTGPADRVASLLRPVFDALAPVVGAARAEDLRRPTPCEHFDVGALRDHVLGWLQFFAVAVTHPDGGGDRRDPSGYRAEGENRDLAEIVRRSGATIADAVPAIQHRTVVVSQSRMDGSAVLAMILGEYVVHGWDLAAATGRRWTPDPAACEAALEFFRGMITPEYRGGEGGFFGAEVPVPPDAPALDRLLGFAGRNPRWQAEKERFEGPSPTT